MSIPDRHAHMPSALHTGRIYMHIYIRLLKPKSADDANKKVKKAVDPKAKAKVESIDFDEDLDAIIKEEATLSDDFRGKAGAIFEAVLTSKLSQEVERLESEYAQNLEEEVTSVQNDLVEKVNGYLDYVVENWMKENEVAVTNGLRTEIAEDFMTSLQGVFKEHYIEVPEGKVDLVDELNEQVTELEVPIIEDNLKSVSKTEKGFFCQLNNGQEIETKTVILAIGRERRKLGLKNEDEWTGKGVSYCCLLYTSPSPRDRG